MNPTLVTFIQWGFGILSLYLLALVATAHVVKDVITHHHKTKAAVQVMLKDQEQGGPGWVREMMQQVREMNRDGQREV